MEVRTDAVSRALEFQIDDVVARYMKDEGLTEEIAREHERELKRFLALCAMNPSAHYGMRGPIDEIWHTFIMFTREYAQFCEHVSGRFIHHVPETGKGESRSADGYLLFLNDYQKVFGQPAPPQYWPRPALTLANDGCTGCGTCSAPEDVPTAVGCGECNGCGSCNVVAD